MRFVRFAPLLPALVIFPAFGGGPTPQPGGFNYQFQLRQNGVPYNGTAEFEFRLWDGPNGSGATQIGPTLPATQTITDGTSNTILLFEQPPPAPPVWDGNERWLEVRVRTPAGSANPFVALTPWQRISSAPYAAYALNSSFSLNNGNAVFTSGNVGVGTMTPGDSLHIATGNLLLGSGVGLMKQDSGGVTRFVVGFDGTDDMQLAAPPDRNMELRTGTGGFTSVRATITPSGRLGIGTAAPDVLLHLQTGDVGATATLVSSNLQLERTTDNYLTFMSPANKLSGLAFGRPGSTIAELSHGAILYNELTIPDAMQFRTGGNLTRMTINSAGFVGIGTTTPAAALHATGDIRADGHVLLPDGTVSAPGLTFTGDSNTGLFRAGLDSLNLVTGGVERLSVDASGVHIPATQRRLSVPSAAFQPSSHTTQFTSQSTIAGTLAGASVMFVAPVLLPDGATINSMRVYFSDGDATNDISVELRSHNYGSSGGGGSIMGSILSSGSIQINQTQSINDNTIIPNVIDSSANCYSLRAEWTVPATPNNIRLHGVVLTYTISSPLP